MTETKETPVSKTADRFYFTDRIYYTVPTHYGNHDEYATLNEAADAAREKQAAYLTSRPDPLPEGIRAFVQVRACYTLPSGRADEVINTYEVNANGEITPAEAAR